MATSNANTATANRQARDFATFSSVARETGGTLLLPDVTAMIEAAVAEARARPLPPIAALGWALVAMGLCVIDATSMFLLTWMGFGWLPSDPFTWFGVVALGACLTCLAATLLEANGIRRLRVAQAREIAGTRAAGHATHGYVLGSGGVIEVTIGRDGPVRHDHPASEVSEVVSQPEDADHVTLLVRTRSGTVEVPWVKRCAAVSRILGTQAA